MLSRCKLVKAEYTIVSRSTRTRFQDVKSQSFELIFKRNVFKDCGLVKTSVQVSEDCKEQLNRRQVWTNFKKIQTNNSCELCLSGDGGRGLQVRCESDQRLRPRACCAAVRQQGGEGGRSARCCPTLHCAALPGGRGEGGESQGDNLLLKMQPQTTCTNRSGAGASLRCRRSDAH